MSIQAGVEVGPAARAAETCPMLAIEFCAKEFYEGSLGLDSRPGGGLILDGHPVPPREKGLYLPAMCRGQTQVDARSGGGSSTPTGRGWRAASPVAVGRGGVCGKILNVIAKSSLSVSLLAPRLGSACGVTLAMRR